MLIRKLLLSVVVASLFGSIHAGAAEYVSPPLSQDAWIERAKAIYGNATRVQRVDSPSFAAAFPNHILYEAVEPTRLPERSHYMAYNPATKAAFDMTKEFNLLLADAGAFLSHPDDALRYGRALAEHGNPEFQRQRQLVTFQDSAWVGRELHDPAVAPLLDGWEVQLATYSAENGVLADWNVRFGFSAAVTAKWRVRDVAVGPARFEFEAANLRSGTWLSNRYLPEYRLEAFYEDAGQLMPMKIGPQAISSSKRLVTTGENFDGSRWEVSFAETEGDMPLSVAQLAVAARDGGIRAYNTHVVRNVAGCAGATAWNPRLNWSFESKDSDCVLEVTVLHPYALECWACIYVFDSSDYDVHIYISPGVWEYFQARGYYRNASKYNMTSFMRNVMGHEHFHNMQFVLMRWGVGRDDSWNTMVEGQARFTETVFDPELQQDPTSFYYTDTNRYQKQTNQGFCSQSYNAAHFWGHAYARHGGIGFIKKALEAATGPVHTYCQRGLPQAFSRAVGAEDLSTSLFADELVSFTIPALTQNFSWSPPHGLTMYDMGMYMQRPTPQAPLLYDAVSNAHRYRTGAWGLSYVALPEAITYDIWCAADQLFHMQIVSEKRDGTVAQRRAQCDESIRYEAEAGDRVWFVAARLGPADETAAFDLYVVTS